jgi:hypothetical protein
VLFACLQGDAIRNYYHERHVIQDMLVPSYKVGDALEFSDREFEVRFHPDLLLASDLHMLCSDVIRCGNVGP